MEQALSFFASAIAGYFILPVFISKKGLHLFLWHATATEATWRDRLLKPITAKLGFASPNAVSLCGFLMVGLLAYLFWSGASVWVVFFAALFAGFSDMLDGSLARNSSRITSLGVVLDVARDVLLALTPSYFLIEKGFLRYNLFLWFFTGWIFLGGIRFLELKITGSSPFSPKEDYKSALEDRKSTRLNSSH